jgi:hypothetical protein
MNVGMFCVVDGGRTYAEAIELDPIKFDRWPKGKHRQSAALQTFTNLAA